MPAASLRPCTYPGCRALVRGASRCDAHPYVRAAREPDPFLSTGRWRGLRAVYLKRHPLCVCGKPATHVDHILSRKQAPDLALEWSNLQGLCVSCHTRKTNEVDGSGWGGSARGETHPGSESYGTPPGTDRALLSRERGQNGANGGPPHG